MAAISQWAQRHRAITVLLLLAVVGMAGAAFSNRPHNHSAAPIVSSSPSIDDPASPSDEPSPSASPEQSPTSSPLAATGSACRSDPLANVYHPSRLRVLAACKTVTGVVADIRHEADGDVHINLTLDRQYASLVNAKNVSRQGGALVVEIVPADEPGCVKGRPPIAPTGTYDYGVCTGASVLTPPLGSHVAVTGPYVLDSLHGWTEIHPAWAISVIGALPAPPAKSLRILAVVPDPVTPGRNATLSARTSAGADCVITVRYPSGRRSEAKGLGPKRANGSGDVSWTWLVGSSTKPGIASAFVTCGSLTRETSFTVG